MEDPLKVTIKKSLGIFLIIIGIAGMILPILPGVWFIPIGLELLGWRLVIDRKKPWDKIIRFIDKSKEHLNK